MGAAPCPFRPSPGSHPPGLRGRWSLPTSRRADTPLPADLICEKIRKATMTAIRALAREMVPFKKKCHGGDQDQYTGQLKDHLLGHDIGGEQLFNSQIAAAAVLQGLAHLLVALPGEVEGFDDAHALQLLQHRLHHFSLCRLPLGSKDGGFPFHGREQQKIKHHARKGQQAPSANPIPAQTGA